MFGSRDRIILVSCLVEGVKRDTDKKLSTNGWHRRCVAQVLVEHSISMGAATTPNLAPPHPLTKLSPGHLLPVAWRPWSRQIGAPARLLSLWPPLLGSSRFDHPGWFLPLCPPLLSSDRPCSSPPRSTPPLSSGCLGIAVYTQGTVGPASGAVGARGGARSVMVQRPACMEEEEGPKQAEEEI